MAVSSHTYLRRAILINTLPDRAVQPVRGSSAGLLSEAAGTERKGGGHVVSLGSTGATLLLLAGYLRASEACSD